MTLIEKLREIADSVTAEDGGLDLSECPREWREDAMCWQADLSDELLLACLEHACEDRWDSESLWAAIGLEIAELHCNDWYREQAERSSEAVAAQERHNARVDAVAAAVGDALRITLDGWTDSRYGCFHGLKVRVSNHCQKTGGGFSENRGERHGEAIISFVVVSAESPIPSRELVRERMLEAIRAYRERGYEEEFVQVVLRTGRKR